MPTFSFLLAVAHNGIDLEYYFLFYFTLRVAPERPKFVESLTKTYEYLTVFSGDRPVTRKTCKRTL